MVPPRVQSSIRDVSLVVHGVGSQRSASAAAGIAVLLVRRS